MRGRSRASNRHRARKSSWQRRSRCRTFARSAAAVDRDRHLVQEGLVLGVGQLRLEALDDGGGAGRGGEQARHDLLGRVELDELLLERPREPAATEIPAVELLQEAGRAAL